PPAAAARASADRLVPAPRGTPPVRRRRLLLLRGPRRLLDGRRASLVGQQPLQCELGALARARFLREIARKRVEPFLERQRLRLQHDTSYCRRPSSLDDAAGCRKEITLPSQLTLKMLHALLLAEPAGGFASNLHAARQRTF